jgi:hypothetical protein
MRNKKGIPIKATIVRTVSFAAILGVVALFSGCSGTYGSYKRDPEIYQSFHANQVNENYTYYYNGVGNQVYAIVGIEPKYQIHSKFWREIKPNTEEFKKLINRLWEDYGYQTYGADLLDPAGNKIGSVYTSIYEVSVKFLGDNQIEVLLGTPYLWGPADGGGGIHISH